MLRRIPATLLVCLAIMLALLFAATSSAATPDQSTEIAFKPGLTGSPPLPEGTAPKSRGKSEQSSRWLGRPVRYASIRLRRSSR